MLKLLLSVSFCKADERHLDEIDFKYIPEASLEFPAGEREFNEWSSYGSAVVGRNKAILVPEVAGARGAIGANFKLRPRF